ncbi:MAG: ABC transporter ATP-binding protein [Acidimicrobiaceae bacterium]|nr:ABC transporter ATP-binding protein [Acidimicrobiaceae bacterium]
MLLRLLARYLRPYRRTTVLLVLLLIAQTAGNLYLPNLNGDIINNGVVAGNLHYIIHTGEWMLVLTLVIGLFSVGGIYWASRVAMGAGADLRSAVFARVQTFSTRDMNDFGTASLITRNTNDVQQIQIFLQMALTMMVVAPIMGVGGIAMALHEGAKLSTLLLVALPIMGAFLSVVMVKIIPKFRSMQVKIDRLNEVLREQITGVRVIRAFVRSDFEAQRFAKANQDLTSTALSVNRTFAMMLPVMMVILNLSSVAVVWFGGRLVSEGAMPIGNLTAFLTYIMQILLSVMMAVMVAILVPRAAASAERVNQVLGTSPVVMNPLTPIVASTHSGVIQFDKVSFAYPGSERPVLEELDFTLKANSTNAIIGGTGSGKTTMLNLIPRFFEATSGHVRVNDVDVREQSLESLWTTLGIVPQFAYLFSGTIESNLRFGRADASDQELWQALQIAQATDFVRAMQGGLEAVIDQGGTNVSGGQRQRLCIARALVKRADVYLFDDCFSALDATTDALLRQALKASIRPATVVIVAQRVSTIMDADQIIVLDNGRVVGVGTHQELLTSCGTYHEIVVSQLGEDATK